MSHPTASTAFLVSSKGMRRYFPNLLRNSIISATEIVVYDMSKQALLEAGMQDGIGTHFTAGALLTDPTGHSKVANCSCVYQPAPHLHVKDLPWHAAEQHLHSQGAH